MALGDYAGFDNHELPTYRERKDFRIWDSRRHIPGGYECSWRRIKYLLYRVYGTKSCGFVGVIAMIMWPNNDAMLLQAGFLTSSMCYGRAEN